MNVENRKTGDCRDETRVDFLCMFFHSLCSVLCIARAGREFTHRVRQSGRFRVIAKIQLTQECLRSCAYSWFTISLGKQDRCQRSRVECECRFECRVLDGRLVTKKSSHLRNATESAGSGRVRWRGS